MTSQKPIRVISTTALAPLQAGLAQVGFLKAPVLLPGIGTAQANQRLNLDLYGDTLKRSVAFLKKSPDIQRIFGSNLEVRPTVGNNCTYTWMDFSARLTLRIVGSQTHGVALLDWRDEHNVVVEVIANGQVTELPVAEVN